MNFSSPIIFLNEETNEFEFDSHLLANFRLSGKGVEENIMGLPVAVISIAGDARKGKSFLLNFFLRYLQRYDQENWIGDPNEPLTGFSWSNGVDSNTIGIVLWPKPFIIKRKDGKRIAVILMDTQGFFDGHTGHTEMKQIYAISTAVSSIQIYNQMQNLQSNHITTLALFSECGQTLLKETGYNAFQKLLILLRDWPNQRQFNYGLDGGLKFLCKKKSDQKNRFIDEWSTLYKCYTEIGCFLMPSPGDGVDEHDFNGEICKLKPNFINYLNIIVSLLLSPEEIAIKSWKGEELQLWEFLHFFAYLASQLKHRKTIDIERLDIDQKTRADNAFRKAICIYSEVTRHAYYNNDKKKTHDFNRAEAAALKVFLKETNNVQIRYKIRARQELEQFFNQFRKDFSENGKWSNWWNKFSKSIETFFRL